MLKGFIKSILFVMLSWMSLFTNASSTYHQYQTYEDAQGNIYLKLPKQFVLIHNDVSIPLMVYPHNGLLKLYKSGGVWKVQALTESQFNVLALYSSDYSVQYIDFGRDGDVEVVIRADDVQDNSFILHGVENGALSLSTHNKYADGVDLSQASGAQFKDVNGDGYIDIVHDDYTLLGNAQDKFFNTARTGSNQANIVGATGGEFRVAEDGSAIYQIPIKLPQGVAGVTPQLAFSYSSNAGNSTLGRGWSLSGLTSINRCPKNYAQDGRIAGITLSINDAYCFNGQRLIRVSGDYGHVNSTYHTELANFAVVTITSANENGATGFTVETKSGETHYYGKNGNDTNALAGDPQAPSAYLISTIADIKNNEINYRYVHHSSIDEINLDTITWGAVNNTNQLKINYMANPRANYGYRHGRQLGQTKLVENVEVKQSGELIRRYNIDWDMGVVEVDGSNVYVTENISRVTGIQECLVDNHTEYCLSPTTFNWSNNQAGATTKLVCLEYADGGARGCTRWGSEPVLSTFMPFSNNKRISALDNTSYRNSERNLVADANGDGLSDVFYIKNGKWALVTMTASGEGDTRTINASYPISSNYSKGDYQYAQIIDTDGDGRMEVIYPENSYWKKISLSPNGTLIRTNIVPAYDVKNNIFLDVNGDSYIDLVRKSSGKLYVNYNYSGSFLFNASTINTDVLLGNEQTAIKVHVQTPKLKNTAFMDINGDGISDFLTMGKSSFYECRKYNWGSYVTVYSSPIEAEAVSACEQEKADDQAAGITYFFYYGVTYLSDGSAPMVMVGSVLTNGTPSYNQLHILNFLSNVDLSKDVRIADFNGDGLSDIIYRKINQWHLAISRSDGTFERSSIANTILSASDSKYQYHRFMDINGDGLSDILAFTGSYFKVLLAQSIQGGTPTFIQRTTVSVDVDDNKQLHFADFDGDSQLDILYEQGSQMRYRLAAEPQQRKNVINLVSSGFGQTTEIEYDLLQNGHQIQTQSDYFEGLARTRPNTNVNNDTYYQSDFVQPKVGLWVVKQVANIGYDSYGIYDDPDDRNKAISISYRYSGMLMHKLGRGSFGFEQLETTDNTTGIVTTTKYSQQYPYVGMPLSTEQRYNGELLSQAINTFQKTTSNKYGTYPYIEQSDDKKWRLSSDGSVVFANHNRLVSNYDQYGNLTESTSQQFASQTATTAAKTTTTENQYNGAGGGAEKGRLSATSVTHTRGAETKTRNSSFTYYADGMLKSSTIHGLNQKTTYEYNAQGSKSKVCVIDQNTSESRCTRTYWSSDGRFVTRVENALGQRESYLYNGQSGGVNGRIWSKTTTGPNGIATTQYFDIQGQVIKEQRADGTISTITRAYASNSNLANCIANAEKLCFSKTSTSSGKPTSIEWYDAYGRKVKSQTKAFDGNQWASQYYTFDELSRGRSTTEPYYDRSSNGLAPTTTKDKTQYSYDVLGRVSQEIMPNGGVNTRQYSSETGKLLTIHTDAEGHIKTEKTNTIGELTEVVSPTYTVNKNGQAQQVNNITKYTYNVFGKLTQVRNYPSNDTSKQTRIHTLYDNHGRKAEMYDPDKGHWTYSYNAFGELTSQTNSNGLTTKNYYDLLGRKTKTTEQSWGSYNATVQCYHYGTSKSAKNVGKLIKQQQFTSTNSALASFNCANNINTTATWQQSISFDNLGRLASTITQFEGKTFTQNQSYDNYSRVSSQTLPEGLVVTTQYQHGYLKRVKQGSLILREINAMYANGRIQTETIGEGMQRNNSFDEMGRIANIELKRGNGQLLHSLTYDFDDIGNLTDRTHNYGNSTYFDEDFVYDGLNRMQRREVGYNNIDVNQLDTAFAYTQHYQYDFIGNITRKYSDVGGGAISNDYQYRYQWGTHNQQTSQYSLARYQLTEIKKDTNSRYRHYNYDNSGNVTHDGSRSYQYTPFDKPWKITSTNGQSSEFKYVDRSRYLRIDHIQEKNTVGVNYNELTQYKNYYVGSYERVERTGGAGNQIEHKYHIAGAVLTRKNGQSSIKTLFAHSDYQGSVITVTDQVGAVAEQFIYDPWGKKSKVIISNTVGSIVSDLIRGSATTRGYTGHEGIDHFNLIHMNGRVYDAEIGRFLQADPHVQAPTNSQNYNRYSYVMNNPMSYTDPSGYFFKKLFKGIGKLWQATVGSVLRAIAKIPILNSVVQIGLSVACGPFAAVCTAAYSAAQTYAITGSLGMSLRAGVISYASAWALKQIGTSDTWGKAGTIENITANAVVGGVTSELQGGKFGHGFFAAGFASAAKPMIYDKWGYSPDFKVQRVAAAAVVGGTASVITGGKFANGAVTGAFNQMYNGETYAAKKWKEYMDWAKNYGPRILTTVGGTIQVVSGAALCSTAIGCALGAPLMAHGANNIYEGVTGKDGLLRDGYQAVSEALTGDAKYGDLAYGIADAGMSLHGATRMVINPNSWKLFRNIPSDYTRAYNVISPLMLRTNAFIDVNTAIDTYNRMDNK